MLAAICWRRASTPGEPMIKMGGKGPVGQVSYDNACLYEHEHALLHRAMQVPAQCTANRRVDTRLLSWQALSCWRCCEPPLARTRHRRWGDRLSLAWWALAMHQLVIRWILLHGQKGGPWLSLDEAGGRSKKKAPCAQFMPDTLASARAACVSRPKLLVLPLTPFFSIFSLHALGCHRFSVPQVWEEMPLHAPGFEVACSHPRPPRLNYRSTLPLRHFDLICSDPIFRIVSGSLPTL